jgi:hypothetical protein
VFLGAPLKVHWGLPDPADVQGDKAAIDAAFEETWRLLDLRVAALLALPFETMEREAKDLPAACQANAFFNSRRSIRQFALFSLRFCQTSETYFFGDGNGGSLNRIALSQVKS